MDCHRPSAFAMTKGAKGGEFFLFLVFALTYYGLWIATSSTNSRNDEG